MSFRNISTTLLFACLFQSLLNSAIWIEWHCVLVYSITAQGSEEIPDWEFPRELTDIISDQDCAVELGQL